MADVNSASSLLRVTDLHVYYNKFHAVHGVDFECRAGEIVSIIGANGAGKSSSLKALIGQVGHLDGSIRLDGEEIAGQRTADIIRKGISLVPEGRWLFPSLSVEENLLIGKQVGRPGGPELSEIFDYFPVLQERRAQKARELSGGQQQQVAIGRSLLANPRVLLCDEISLGLSPIVVQSLYAILPKIKERDIGIIVVEQDIGRSLAIADRFYCFLEGKVTLSGNPTDVTREIVAKNYFGS